MLAIDFAKAIPRPSTVGVNITPDFYPLENITKGFNALGHVKKVHTPLLHEMPSRDNRTNKSRTTKKHYQTPLQKHKLISSTSKRHSKVSTTSK